MKSLIVAIALAVFSMNASAVLVADAGPVYDQIRGAYTLDNSGSLTEELSIEAILGIDIVYNQLDELDSAGSSWEAVTDGVAGDYALDFSSILTIIDPVYFLVKVGGGDGTETDETHYLFENLESLEWGFINLSWFGSEVQLMNIGVISHVGVVDDGSTSVPEPGVVGLLAIGLLGMVATRRKMKV